MEENLLRERIQMVLNAHKYSVYKLSTNESERSKLTNQIKGKTTISAMTVKRILNTFPDVSAEWLLRGAGEMIKQQSQSIVANGSAVNNGTMTGHASLTANPEYNEIIALYQQQNDDLRKQVEFLQAMLKSVTNNN